MNKDQPGFANHQQVGFVALSGLFGALIPDAIFTSSMIVFLVIFYLVWIFPTKDVQFSRKNQNYFRIHISLCALLLGIGAAWICWKIEPYYEAVIEVYSGNWKDASKLLMLAIDRDPGNPYYQYAVGFTTGEEACIQGESFSVPIAYYEKALLSFPNWDIGLVNLASLHAVTGNYSQAVNLMEDVVSAYPYKSFYKCLLGDYYWELDQRKAAITAYASCIFVSPDILVTTYWEESGKRLSIQDQAVEEARIQYSESEQDLLKESKLAFYSGDKTEALRLVLDFLESDSFDLEANLLRYSILDQLGRLPEIEDHLEKMLKLYPENQYLWSTLGRIALLNNESQKAEQAFKISNLRGRSMVNTLELGNLYLANDQPELADIYYSQALDLGAYIRTDFSRLVASRWPILGIYNSCVSDKYSNIQYVKPALEAAQKLQYKKCNISACLLLKLSRLDPPVLEAINLLKELPCYQDIEPAQCDSLSE
jgi:tetratricopeptide (TPR) repeat protein